jgi:four helix bundle protein
MPFKFEKLNVWQSSLDISEKIHLLTKVFPKDELFILTQQIKRAADSIGLNIAEGATGQSNSEFKKFLGYAIRSSAEVVACLYLATRRKYIEELQFQQHYEFLDSLTKSIQALRNSIN